MYTRAAILLVAMLSAGALTGCYESASVTIYKPGEFKGSTDPLLALQRQPEQQQKLQERFNLVQLDR